MIFTASYFTLVSAFSFLFFIRMLFFLSQYVTLKMSSTTYAVKQIYHLNLMLREKIMVVTDLESATSQQIARLASVFSDGTRVRILLLLRNKASGATTMDIATILRIAQPRVSSHLAILRKTGLVSVEGYGRQRVYRINLSKTASILRTLGKSAGTLVIKQRREDRKDPEIRKCRSCYDHLAGEAGVELLGEMQDRRWLSRVAGNTGRPEFRLTDLGSKALLERGVDIEFAAKSNRSFAHGCLDWTEREPHLGGALGKAVMNSIIQVGIVKRIPGTRAMKLSGQITEWMAPV